MRTVWIVARVSQCRGHFVFRVAATADFQKCECFVCAEGLLELPSWFSKFVLVARSHGQIQVGNCSRPVSARIAETRMASLFLSVAMLESVLLKSGPDSESRNRENDQ